MVILRRLISLGLLAAFLYASYRLATSNDGLVDVELIWMRFPNVPLWGALAASFGVGAALMAVLSSISIARKSLTARKYRKAVQGLEAEVHQLRNLPLAISEDSPAPKPGKASGKKAVAAKATVAPAEPPATAPPAESSTTAAPGVEAAAASGSGH